MRILNGEEKILIHFDLLKWFRIKGHGIIKDKIWIAMNLKTLTMGPLLWALDLWKNEHCKLLDASR